MALTSFRSHIKGWIAWVFVILVSVPFALWGVSSYRSVLTSNYVAKVNGQEISPNTFQNAYQNAYRQRQTTLGGKFNPTPAQEKALKQQVLQQLIMQTLLREQAQNYHMVASQAEVRYQIRKLPAFQVNGQFNFQQYQAVLAANNLTPEQFEARVRTDQKSQILQQGLAGSAFATPHATDALIGLLKQQRKITWFSLPLAHFTPKAEPTRKEISAYYQSHKKTFTTPMSVTINYVQLDPKTLEAHVKADPASLKSWYRTHQSKYGTPAARKAAEILIAPAAASAKASAKSGAGARAKKLATEVRAASNPQKKFAALARKYSADNVSSRNGGSIGYVGRGQLSQALDDALFGIAKIGGIAGPVQTRKGWYLIQLLGKRAGSVKPYSAVAAQVKDDYLKSKAKARYFDLGDKLANLAYENSSSLDPIAKKLGLDIKTITDVTREHGTAIAANAKIRDAAFSGDVLKLHRNSEPVKLGDLNAVVLRVSDSRPSKLKPLSKVHDQVVSAIRKRQAKASAASAIARAKKAVGSGETMGAVAKSLNVKLNGPKTFGRASASNLPAAVAQAAFAKAPPAPDKPEYGTVQLQNGSPALYALLNVASGSAKQLKSQERQAYMSQLAQLQSNRAMTEYVAWLRKRADVKIIQKNIP